MPVVPISASKNEGVAELVTVALRTVQNNERPKHHDFCKGEVHRAIHSLAHMIEDHAEEKKIPLRVRRHQAGGGRRGDDGQTGDQPE